MSDPEQAPRAQPPSGHSLARAMIDLPIRAVSGPRGRVPPASGNDTLPPALAAERREMDSSSGRLSYYVAGPPPGDLPPLLLIHSINAAASAYEVRPLFEARCARTTVYALDLPGFGFSERSRRRYDPGLMKDAILAMVAQIRRLHGPAGIDALALSLSAEFLARAATEAPALFRTLSLISPTGFDSRGRRDGPPGSTRARPGMHGLLTAGLWRKALFRLLTSRLSIRYFLEKTWGSKAIDEGLFEYDVETARRPGAEHAPLCFISGFMFSNDITRVYEQLTLPVWMIHGVRGDFTDYAQASAFAARPNWTVASFETGALPHFEQPGAVDRAFAAFLERQDPPGA